MTGPLTQTAAANLVKLIIVVLLVNLGVVCYVFYTGYEGRVDIVDGQLKGCERAKLDRTANALGWRNAEAARKADGQLEVAATYAEIAQGLEDRSAITCSDVYPKARFIP